MRLNYEEKQCIKHMLIGICVIIFGALTVPLCDDDATFCLMILVCAVPYEYIAFRCFMTSRFKRRRIRRIERKQRGYLI